MGFRFFNLSPIYKSYISRISSCSSSHIMTRFNYFILPTDSHFQGSLIFSNNPHYKIPRRWQVGHYHDHHRSGQEGENIFKLGLAADFALATGNALTGYLSGSTAIIADAAHSISDVDMENLRP